MMGKFAFCVGMLCASVAQAQDTTLRPILRSTAEIIEPAGEISRPKARRVLIAPETPQEFAGPEKPTLAAFRPALRPYERPDLARGAATQAQRRAEESLFAFSPTAPVLSQRPSGRTAEFIQVMADQQAALQRGQVCNDPMIQGEAIGVVEGRGRCGIDSAVLLKSVAGVQLRPNATVDCQTAQALKTWVTTGVQPATDNQAISLRIVSHYACRNRNSAASGRLSEHAFGRAIDIAGIGLKDGREVTVLTGWNSNRDSAALRRMWQAACGPFGTVLGPEANRFHRDHFHFDTARYRSGSYCR